MLCRNHGLGIAVVGFCALVVAGALQAAPPSDQLLPKTTKGYASVGDIARFRADWAKTQLGQLMADPIMQPFVDDFQQQQQGKGNLAYQKLGITWDDLSKVSAGEVAVAVVQPSPTTAALVLIVDVTGRKEATAKLLEKVKTNLIKSYQAKASQIDVAGTPVTSYAIAKTKQQPARTALFCVKQDRLIATDNLEVLRGVLGRFAAPAEDSLSALPPFKAVIERCKKAAGEQIPHVRWFVEPFGYVEATRIANPETTRRRGTDMHKVLKDVGFAAVQGLGGYLHLATDKFEFLHQTAVYAPPVNAGENRYKLAANMLDFPNGGDLKPQPWIPREIATYASFNLKPSKIFEALEPLVDATYGEKEGFFKDIIDSIEEDPNGAHINMRKDLVNLLGGRATIVSDNLLPITPKSERMLLAVETKDDKTLAANIEKLMKAEPDAKLREYKEHVIWEIINTDAEANADTDAAATVKKAESSTSGKNRPARSRAKREEEEDEENAREHMLPNSSVTVAHGHLLVASHYDLLTKMLDELAQREQVVDSNEFQLVKAELDRLSGGKTCAQAFSRTDEEFRAPYELIRAGRMPEAESVLGNLLNRTLGEEGVVRVQRINGEHLPEYDAVRRYFGPAGMTAMSEEDGWFLTGFTLSKEPPAALAEKPSDVK